MPAQTIFKWRDGRGWLTLATGQGAAQEIDDIRARALQRTSADGGVAIVFLGDDPDAGERLLDDLEDLGAPTGYVVDVIAEDDATIRERLTDASVIVIFGAPIRHRHVHRSRALPSMGSARHMLTAQWY